jgi:N-acetylmuramoyl-L-alanine amidase
VSPRLTSPKGAGRHEVAIPSKARDRALPYTFAAVGLALLANASLAAGPEVALDIGHYLEEPGVISASGVTEFELNRKLASAVAARLAGDGVQARLIGADGQHASLGARTREARGTRLFASIHHDSTRARFQPVRDPRFAGFSLWVSRKNRDADASIGCAERVVDKLIEAGFTPSHYHADPELGEGRPVIDWQRGIFARDALAVLNTAHSPAILIEVGVVVNPEEEARLRQPEVFSAQVAAIAEGIRICLRDQR